MYAASATSAAKATVIEASSAIDVAQAYGFGKGTMDVMRFVFNRDPISQAGRRGFDPRLRFLFSGV